MVKLLPARAKRRRGISSGGEGSRAAAASGGTVIPRSTGSRHSYVTGRTTFKEHAFRRLLPRRCRSYATANAMAVAFRTMFNLRQGDSGLIHYTARERLDQVESHRDLAEDR